MIQIGIAELNKTPSIIDNMKDIATIVNKKTKDVKGYFIPVEYEKYIENIINEIEYKRFLQRNQSLAKYSNNEDETILDGLDEEY